MSRSSESMCTPAARTRWQCSSTLSTKTTRPELAVPTISSCHQRALRRELLVLHGFPVRACKEVRPLAALTLAHNLFSNRFFEARCSLDGKTTGHSSVPCVPGWVLAFSWWSFTYCVFAALARCAGTYRGLGGKALGGTSSEGSEFLLNAERRSVFENEELELALWHAVGQKPN
jgi:hypothetical protein